MKLKLIDKLRRKSHKDIALLQDMVMEITYEIFPQAILHGGTAIWRCYGGTRFSEDIDLYLRKTDLQKIEQFKTRLKQRRIDLQKFRITANALYAKVVFNGTEVRVESSFLEIKGKTIVVAPYETAEGNYLNIFTLSPESLVEEKVSAYLSRVLIRDIYDIYILLNHCKDMEKVKIALAPLLTSKKIPTDEEVLGTLVLVGAVPNTQQIFAALQQWVK
ncbi:nucleotidyl transferase AbiEii/AbiGii toxin family protein [Candidatus Woesearchaeota archaeon]|nr:nucleotidyl transferase AbiEii/AbiGii toxin family protein [Candidatus Woesearchaeota archaeon]